MWAKMFKYIIVLFSASNPIQEGSNITLPVCLSNQPSSDVTVSLSGTGLSFSPTSLTFTSVNYSSIQNVTVTVINDITDTSGIETKSALVRVSSTSDLDYINDSLFVGIKTFDNTYSINAVLAQDTLINRAKKYTAKGLDSLRIQLVRSLWDRYTLPAISAVVSNPSYTGTYKILNPLLTSSCKELTYSNSFFSYKAYVFEPISSNGKIVYYTDGHFNTPTDGGQVPLLDSCLARGYIVSYIPMLGYFGSTQYLVPISQIHTINPQTYISSNPLVHFLNGYVAVINYCENHYFPSESVIMGLSGGGWATTVMGAIDTRLDRVISMSGTQPSYVNWYAGFGDFEQGFASVTPSFINIFYNESGRYLDLYTLCSYQRRYVQIQAQYDPCCYGGKYYQTWVDSIKQTTAKVGGYFNHYLTQQSCHCVGSKISIVLSEL